jgi:hypothetical protein
MEFAISTPALLFSAISLLMLAYTNRFLALANLIRQMVAAYNASPDENIIRQIDNFKTRLRLIKYTQVFGVVSFILCVVCMFLIMLKLALVAEYLFVASLVLLAVSLSISLYEVFISIGALRFELEKIERRG